MISVVPYQCTLLVVVQDGLLPKRAKAVLVQRVNMYGIANMVLGSQICIWRISELGLPGAR